MQNYGGGEGTSSHPEGDGGISTGDVDNSRGWSMWFLRGRIQGYHLGLGLRLSKHILRVLKKIIPYGWLWGLPCMSLRSEKWHAGLICSQGYFKCGFCLPLERLMVECLNFWRKAICQMALNSYTPLVVMEFLMVFGYAPNLLVDDVRYCFLYIPPNRAHYIAHENWPMNRLITYTSLGTCEPRANTNLYYMESWIDPRINPTSSTHADSAKLYLGHIYTELTSWAWSM